MRYRYCYWFHHSTSLGIGNALTMWLLLYNPSLYLLRVKHIVVSCFILHSWSQHRLYIYEIIVDLQIVWVTVLLPILLLIVCFYPSQPVSVFAMCYRYGCWFTCSLCIGYAIPIWFFICRKYRHRL